jgi:hypothetical protein
MKQSVHVLAGAPRRRTSILPQVSFCMHVVLDECGEVISPRAPYTRG